LEGVVPSADDQYRAFDLPGRRLVGERRVGVARRNEGGASVGPNHVTDVLTVFIFIFIHQAGSNMYSNNGKLNSKHLIKYYNLLQNWQKPFTVEMYHNINLSCPLF